VMNRKGTERKRVFGLLLRAENRYENIKPHFINVLCSNSIDLGVYRERIQFTVSPHISLYSYFLSEKYNHINILT
jgi:hypothetical protein